jgi:hypothetical protein
VNPKIARAALEKRRADEAEYARLIEENMPAAPIYTGLDGGMNQAFHARFPDKVTSFARAFPAASQLPQVPPAQFVDNDGSLASKMFGTSNRRPAHRPRLVHIGHKHALLLVTADRRTGATHDGKARGLEPLHDRNDIYPFDEWWHRILIGRCWACPGSLAALDSEDGRAIAKRYRDNHPDYAGDCCSCPNYSNARDGGCGF